MTVKEAVDMALAGPALKIVISKPRDKEPAYRKIVMQSVRGFFEVSRYTKTQVFHAKAPPEEVPALCAKLLEGEYLQLNSWCGQYEHGVMISKKGKVTHTRRAAAPEEVPEQGGHNREKKYLYPQGEVIAPLVDMGVFTAQGKVVNSMYDKYRQINRFIEMIDDVARASGKERWRIIDFGCGKSYLTFIIYDYFTRILGKKAVITGLDIKEDVIDKCSRAAEKYGYEGLRFLVGDIREYRPEGPVDMVISLHACDTATDYALYNAVMWQASYILSVPCCQHELNGQMQSREFAILTKYGIIKERMAALMTDAIRANMLQYRGYKTQVLEFVDYSHTPKNLLIRASKANSSKAVREKALAEAQSLMREYNLSPTVYRLLAGPQE